MFLKPQKGVMVYDPARGDSLPDDGREVEKNQYWLRRIADGDVIETTAAGKQNPAPKPLKKGDK